MAQASSRADGIGDAAREDRLAGVGFIGPAMDLGLIPVIIVPFHPSVAGLPVDEEFDSKIAADAKERPGAAYIGKDPAGRRVPPKRR